VLIESSDLFVILVLVLLEGILSADNALVLAVLVLQLPESQQRRALRYGILGAYVLRTIATLLAIHLIRLGPWVALLGGLYLLYLPFKHFVHHEPEPEPGALRKYGKGFLGLSLFWTVVIKVELTDLVFAVDSILVAVGMTDKPWIIITGGILGITMMRLLTLQVLGLVKRFPRLVDVAYIIVGWVGVKLMFEWMHDIHLISFEIPKEIGIGVVVVLFAAGVYWASRHKATGELAVSEVENLFSSQQNPVAGDTPVEQNEPEPEPLKRRP
jgi:YkoY family integral membrane protein